MKVPFELSVMFFMIISGVTLIMLSLGVSSDRVSRGKYFKPAMWVLSGLLFAFLMLTAIFVIEW